MGANLNSLHEAWQQVSEKHLLIVGDLILDRYTWGNASRVSPEAPVIVLQAGRREYRLGGAASVAMLAASLGASVSVAGVIGEDESGRVLREMLAHYDIGDCTVVADRQTTTKERFLGKAGNRHAHQILRVDYESTVAISTSEESALIERVSDARDNCDAVLISDYAKGCCTPTLVRYLIDKMGKETPVLVDPGRFQDYSMYRGAAAITPNRTEGALVFGDDISDVAIGMRAAQNIRERFNVDTVFLTLDRDGLAIADSEGQSHYPTQVREAYDITGAGDMVLATIGLCMAANLSLDATAQMANIAAGLQVERIGVAPVYRDEIACEIRGEKYESKVASADEANDLAQKLHRSGRRIVFTNGCFDILHAGHVQYLSEAAELGDCLIVGINSDASVKAIKGETRPIIPEGQRAQMLAALSCVDYVIIFDEHTPHRLLEVIRPHELVKGGTYGPAEVVGREIVDAYGGNVSVLSETKNLSTTAIVNAIAQTTRSV